MAAAELSPYGPPPPELSELELRLVAMIASGATLEEAAARLHYSYGWIRRVDAKLRRRLGVRTRAELVALVIGCGLVPSPHRH